MPPDLSEDGSIPPPPGETKRKMCCRFMTTIVLMQLIYVAGTAIAEVARGRSLGVILTNVLAAVFPRALRRACALSLYYTHSVHAVLSLSLSHTHTHPHPHAPSPSQSTCTLSPVFKMHCR